MFGVLVVNVRGHFFNQVFNRLEPDPTYRIVQRRLSVLVHMLRIPLHLLHQRLYYVKVTLSSCVENGRLAVAVDVIRFAALGIEKLHHTQFTLSHRIEKRGLAQLILLDWVYLGFIDQILNDLKGIVLVLVEASEEYGVVLKLLIDEVSRGDPDSLLFLFDCSQVALHDTVHEIFRECRCHLQVLLQII